MADKDTVSMESFTELALRLISVYSDDNWTADLRQFALISDGAHQTKTLSLGNLYQNYLDMPSPANLLTLHKQIRALANPVPLPSDRNELRACLLPCLRTLSFFQGANVRARAVSPTKGASGELVCFPYADVLAVGLVFDKEATVHHVRHFELAQIGLDADSAMDIAVQNLKRLSLDPMRQVQRGFYCSSWKDFHDGCRLLLPEIFTRLKLDGEPVALYAGTDTLMVTGSRDVVGLELLTTLGGALVRSSNGVAALPLVLRDGVWETFYPPAADPAFDMINTYRQNVLKMLYKEQDSYLVASFGAKITSVLAPFAIENDKITGSLFSKTSVLEGAAILIPQTDMVEFFRKNLLGVPVLLARATFGKVYQVLKNKLTQEPDLQPACWRISQFPSAHELTAIGKMPLEQSPFPFANSSDELAVFRALVALPIPKGATPSASTADDPSKIKCEFVVHKSVADVQAFYLKELPVGGFHQLDTPQGAIFQAEVIGAACERIALFGPGKFKSDTLLRLFKKVNYDTLAMRNALIKQSEQLRYLENFFGFSIPDNARIEGAFRLSDKGGSQNLLFDNTPAQLVQYFRTQMFGDNPIFLPANKTGAPHVVMDTDNGIVIAIPPEPRADGSLVSLSRHWKSGKDATND